MAMLTKRSMGLTNGFCSNYRKDDLVQKLGSIEHRAGELITEVCDRVCRYSGELDDFEMDSICAGCPLSRLHELIE